MFDFHFSRSEEGLIPGGGGGGGVGMKWTGMLVVSLRGVNFGFWSRLGCSGHNVIILKHNLTAVHGCNPTISVLVVLVSHKVYFLCSTISLAVLFVIIFSR